MEDQITNKDILEAINLFSTNVDKHFDGVDKRFDGVEERLLMLENKMDEGFSSIRSEIAEVKRDLLERINKLDNTTKQDTDVIVRDYLALKTRVEKLEQQVQQLQPA